MWVITNTVAAWLLLPGVLLLLAAWGLTRLRRHPRSGKALIALALAALWVLGMPFCSRALLQAWEPIVADPLKASPAQAIVVLGGGQYHHAPEYGGADTVSEPTLSRLRYAAYLHRQTGKPILTSGGAREGSPQSEAAAMKAALEADFRVPVTWIEGASNNTLENARLSRTLLAAQGIKRIYLVTHAWHMPRAQRVFVQAGFDVAPAPTLYATHFRTTAIDFMPSATALRDSSRVLHELLGLAWYRLKSVVN